jgi:hypothetical protein
VESAVRCWNRCGFRDAKGAAERWCAQAEQAEELRHGLFLVDGSSGWKKYYGIVQMENAVQRHTLRAIALEKCKGRGLSWMLGKERAWGPSPTSALEGSCDAREKTNTRMPKSIAQHSTGSAQHRRRRQDDDWEKGQQEKEGS